MYCSLRYYFDEVPDLIKSDCILSLLDIFGVELGVEYDYISYNIWHPDKDELLISKKYSYDERGKASFEKTEITPLITGEWGDESAAFISAECNHKIDQLYSKVKVDLQFSTKQSPFIVAVDYEEKFTEKMNILKYKDIILKLDCLGFKVNNSFMSKYLTKKNAVTFDRGQIGSIIGCNGRRNIKKSVIHAKMGYLNHIVDVYNMNSLPKNLLNTKILNSIKVIVGCNNIEETKNTFIFSMPQKKSKILFCRMKCRRAIKECEKV